MLSDSKIHRCLKGLPEDLKDKISTWFQYDENEETINEVKELCENKSIEELHKRFDERILFGTAGLRSRMEAGLSRMNTLTVLQSTQGLAEYIKSQFPSNLTAVVGHDHRYHSKEFAEITATVFLNAGFKVYYLNPKDKFVHTPLVPFGINLYHASVGVMITASHNPKMDNGYKVYYNNGCQIIPPHDHNIAKSIDENLEPLNQNWKTEEVISKALHDARFIYSKEEVLLNYMQKLNEYIIPKNVDLGTNQKDRKPWFVYTPMHGVGYQLFHRIASTCLNLVEDIDYICVKEQIVPDPSFPTVSFPNPEEKGSLDLGIKYAKKHNINVVVANDPDADRFSIATRNPQTGEFKQLTGNEIGFLFAYFMWKQYSMLPEDFKKISPLAMINSTVSSQMIKKMAEVENFHYEDTLTGFKWIGNKALELEKKGYFVPFGFEEAIGYMFPKMEFDKDGIAATVVFLQAYYCWSIKEQLTPFDILEKGFAKYGVFKEYNGYYLVKELSSTKKVFDYIREQKKNNEKYVTKIGTEFKITSFRDLTLGYQSDTKDNLPRLPIDPSSQMITITAIPTSSSSNSSVRFTMRGSGTEPKLKVYIEANAETEAVANELAKLTWDVLRREWFRPEQTGLTTNF